MSTDVAGVILRGAYGIALRFMDEGGGGMGFGGKLDAGGGKEEGSAWRDCCGRGAGGLCVAGEAVLTGAGVADDETGARGEGGRGCRCVCGCNCCGGG